MKGWCKVLDIKEIKKLIDDDYNSIKKRFARIGQAYYEGEHDIKKYRVFYFNDDDKLVEDTMRSNIKIPHPFFTELVDQATQYILSTKDGFIKSSIPELQAEMDARFNNNEDFTAELSELLTGVQVKGLEYMYATKDKDGKTIFKCADALGVVEVDAKYASDNKKHILYWYVEKIDKNGKTVKRIMDCDDKGFYYYKQLSNGKIEEDMCYKGKNFKPHLTYTIEDDENTYYETFDVIPFFRIDNNRKQFSALKPIKALIDDYDIMASSLSNNLVDFDNPILLVKGYEGDNLDKLQKNVRTKKLMGVDDEGGMEVHTVNIPYEARSVKLELDEKGIYRFGMGLNTAGLKDTNATTNIAIKSAYSLLDLKCSKLIIQLKQLLKKMIKLVLDEINKAQETDYSMDQITIEFEPEVMSNAQENAQIALVEAQEQQARINTLLSLAAQLDNETLMQNICEVMDIEYEEIKSKLPNPEEANAELVNAQVALDGVALEGELNEGI